MEFINEILGAIESFFQGIGIAVGEGLGGILLSFLIGSIVSPFIGMYFANQYQKKRLDATGDPKEYEVVRVAKKRFYSVTGGSVVVLTALFGLLLSGG
jgi:hypothetical protein